MFRIIAKAVPSLAKGTRARIFIAINHLGSAFKRRFGVSMRSWRIGN